VGRSVHSCRIAKRKNAQSASIFDDSNSLVHSCLPGSREREILEEFKSLKPLASLLAQAKVSNNSVVVISTRNVVGTCSLLERVDY
jgi:hypothetical protein